MHAILQALLANPQVFYPLLVVIISSLITGLTAKPTPETNALVIILKWVLGRISAVTHTDATGTYKIPVFQAATGSATPPIGKLMIAFLILLPAPARAQAMPTSTCPKTVFGGPAGKWMCFAPSYSLSLMDYNLTTQKFEAGFTTGIGYGFSVHQNDWYGFSVHVYMNINPALATGNASLIVTIFNGYIGAGLAHGMFNDHDWRLPVTGQLSFLMGTLERIREFLKAHTEILLTAEQIEAWLLEKGITYGEAELVTALPILGVLFKPAVDAIAQKYAHEVEADTATVFTNWLNTQPGFVVPGDKKAGIISLVEHDTKTGVDTPLDINCNPVK